MRKLLLLTLLVVGIAISSEDRAGELIEEISVPDSELENIFAGSKEKLSTEVESKIILWDEARNYRRGVNRLRIRISPEKP